MTMSRSLGRPPKGGQPRRVVQAKLPLLLREQLAVEAERRGVPLTDLGAVYLLDGWNAARAVEGLAPIPTPTYLEGLQVDPATSLGEVQEPLLAS